MEGSLVELGVGACGCLNHVHVDLCDGQDSVRRVAGVF